MINLFHAILFTGMTAAAGLGIASIIMTLFPVTVEGQTKAAKGEERVEYAFFGFAGIVIALVLLLAINLS
ncbi:hypothetical protein [Aliidiomarina quisquiliarum]|uniref:hypothetical protein n=1 Tax=Aliidiomarina quisquiliarum TaxID=2938947 RepID=UPI00208EF032|nr:hypothetical protein [Aliidiomarina quisquiliarum]MCO4321800.1 hypothetical protein [Aliidiomarina quisquiliarum]